jgi:hypothetical protein
MHRVRTTDLAETGMTITQTELEWYLWGAASGIGDGTSLQQALAEWQRSSEALREFMGALFEALDESVTEGNTIR